jgi:tRNA (guanine37-N1)-methyltransferase
MHELCTKSAHGDHADVLAKVEHYLGGPLDEAPAVHNVRDVAPNKLMLCISFRVPRAVAFHGREQQQQQDNAAEQSPAAKRPKVADG